MTWTIIGAGAVLLTIFSLRWINLAYSIAATLAWLALWIYNLSYPLTNVTHGTLLYDAIFYGLLMMAVGTMVGYLFNKRRGYSGYPMTAKEQAEFNRELKEEPEEKSIMAMSSKEYAPYIHRRRVGR